MTLQEQLTVDLWLLDAVLTGHDSRAGRGDENQLVDVERFANGELFYLSDGGYSRVFFSETKWAVCLASESVDEVRAKWRDTGTIRLRIETTIKQWASE